VQLDRQRRRSGSLAVAVSDFALISARLAWSRCGIRLRSGGIRLRPNLCTPGVISSRYLTSLWQYPTSPKSLHAQHGLVAVFDFAVAVSDFALISSRFLQVVVTAPGHGGREIGLWREIICNFNQLRVTLQAICAPPVVPPPWGSHLSQTRRTEELKKQK